VKPVLLIFTDFYADKPSKPFVRIPTSVAKGDSVTLECQTSSLGNISLLMLCFVSSCLPLSYFIHVNNCSTMCVLEFLSTTFVTVPYNLKIILILVDARKCAHFTCGVVTVDCLDEAVMRCLCVTTCNVYLNSVFS